MIKLTSNYFTYETKKKKNTTFPFLYSMLSRTDNDLKLNVYRKSTDKYAFKLLK